MSSKLIKLALIFVSILLFQISFAVTFDILPHEIHTIDNTKAHDEYEKAQKEAEKKIKEFDAYSKKILAEAAETTDTSSPQQPQEQQQTPAPAINIQPSTTATKKPKCDCYDTSISANTKDSNFIIKNGVRMIRLSDLCECLPKPQKPLSGQIEY